ncbi:MAG: response regulator [Kiritimatiellaceae bacterium]|nr:response regulator [Kiritimatiellaceae bacterium]
MAHILVIEDDESVCRLFGQFLEGEGFTVSQASNGKEGLALLKQQKPDLVITDIMMPEMDGLEVIRNLRHQHAGLPVIAISGGMKTASVNFLPHAKKFGADCVFEKPVSLTALLAVVRKLLSKPD